MRHLLLLAPLALLPTAGEAQMRRPPGPWLVFQEGGRGISSVDTTRIVIRGDTAEIWLRFDYDSPDPLPEGTGTFQRVDVHTRVNCRAERIDDVGMELRDAQDRLVYRSGPTSWHTFREHPFGEHVLPPLCERLPGLVR